MDLHTHTMKRYVTCSASIKSQGLGNSTEPASQSVSACAQEEYSDDDVFPSLQHLPEDFQLSLEDYEPSSTRQTSVKGQKILDRGAEHCGQTEDLDNEIDADAQHMNSRHERSQSQEELRHSTADNPAMASIRSRSSPKCVIHEAGQQRWPSDDSGSQHSNIGRGDSAAASVQASAAEGMHESQNGHRTAEEAAERSVAPADSPSSYGNVGAPKEAPHLPAYSCEAQERRGSVASPLPYLDDSAAPSTSGRPASTSRKPQVRITTDLKEKSKPEKVHCHASFCMSG